MGEKTPPFFGVVVLELLDGPLDEVLNLGFGQIVRALFALVASTTGSQPPYVTNKGATGLSSAVPEALETVHQPLDSLLVRHELIEAGCGDLGEGEGRVQLVPLHLPCLLVAQLDGLQTLRLGRNCHHQGQRSKYQELHDFSVT